MSGGCDTILLEMEYYILQYLYSVQKKFQTKLFYGFSSSVFESFRRGPSVHLYALARHTLSQR
jgi:hypothetical protein